MEFKMTVKEADRYSVMMQVQSKKMSIKQASQEIGLSYRQARRLWKRYEREGPKGLVSRRRGTPSPCRIPQERKETAIDLIKERYSDYGPTLIAEKLNERHDISFSKETLRKWMIEEDLWRARERKKRKVYARRTRRSRVGELIQIDGSIHHWFEDRGERCCLLLCVDDATSRIMGMRFCKTETTDAYFALLEGYLLKHGRPQAFYSDKHGVFRVNMKGCDEHITSFHRALQELNIELICAHSPQAKGRVERANGTLQDRLVKELREQGISSIEEGNAFLSSFQEKYNKKFGKTPNENVDAHRPLREKHDLSTILLKKSKRKLSRELSFSYENEIYLIESDARNRLFGKHVDVYEKNGEVVYVGMEGRQLTYKKWKERAEERPKVLGVKELESLWSTKARKPGRRHPWR